MSNNISTYLEKSKLLIVFVRLVSLITLTVSLTLFNSDYLTYRKRGDAIETYPCQT